MEDYDPMRETKMKQFPKELKNIGIDQESIEKVSPVEKKAEGYPAPEQKIKEEKDSKYGDILARVGKCEEMIGHLDSRITSIVTSMNKVMNEFNDRLCILREKARPEAKQEKLAERSADKGTEDFKPGDIKIEDYFNFSNAKFK